MKARQLIGNASYGPEQLKVLFEVFDEAWAAVEPSVGNDRGAIEATRLKLANIVLSLAGRGHTDAAGLKSTALKLLAGPGGQEGVPPALR